MKYLYNEEMQKGMVKNKMNGEERRNKIIDYIEHSPVPVQLPVCSR